VRRRILTVVLALVLAVLGTVGVLAYVHKADNRALQGMRAVSVLVAQGPIPAGTSANSAQQTGLLRSETLPASSVPVNSVRSITPALGSLVMSAQIQPGQLLLRPMLVTAAQATGGVALPAGLVAVSIGLCIPEAVAENIGPGSEVEVLNTFARNAPLSAAPNCQGPHAQQANGTARTRVVLQRVEVLSLGVAAGAGRAASITTTTTTNTSTGVFNRSTTDGPSTSSQSNVNVPVTLAVTKVQALQLVQIAETGLPYLALLQH
jgi:pilus assembly protein CpaB